MPRPRMRPSFRVDVDCSADQLRETIERQLASESEEVEGDLSFRHGFLRVPPERRRFWTPCLELTLEDCEQAPGEADPLQSRLWGTFSPRAEIWTAFVFTIGSLIISSVFASMYGLAQLFLGHPPFALLIPLGAAIAAGFVYVSALVGQGLSISDMYRLRAFVDDCLREAEAGALREAEAAALREAEAGALGEAEAAALRDTEGTARIRPRTAHESSQL